MAMFTKGEEKMQPVASQNDRSETVIGATVSVEGTFHSEDNMLIEGSVTGVLNTTKNLTVGKGARIKADVTAANMLISGEIHGNLNAVGTIQLTSSARVYGDVETDIISIETGAVLQGRCTTGKKNAGAAKDTGIEKKK
jgi:cytoskeletal protein CcmA (bactofilin family)